MVDTLADLSALESGQTKATYEPTDLAEVTANLASVFRSAIESSGLRYVVTCRELPQPVYVDHAMWEKIVSQLLSNAVAHTFEGEIGVTVRASGSHAALVVRDTGGGIPAEHLPHVFARSYRVPTAKSRVRTGQGVGLTLVQKLAEQHAGTVEIESTVGMGTMVTVRLPFGAAHLPAPQVVTAATTRSLTSTMHAVDSLAQEMLGWFAPAPAKSEAAKRVSGATEAQEPRARVLVADDNADMRDFLSGLLGSRYDVQTVSDGEAALAAARANPPDLVLSDVMMPRLDGIGLLRALRDDPRTQTVSVILVSARAGEDSRVEGLDVGADDYLEKPFTTRELVARVSGTLRLSRMRRQVMVQEQRAAVAESANEAKTRFLTTMSHELRTPLNAITGYVDLYEMGLYGPVTAEQLEALQRIRRSGQRLLGLITNILNFTQLQSGQVEYQSHDFAVRDLLASVGESVEPQMRQKNITYVCDPSACNGARVFSDPDRVTQILLNLLSNAVKFTGQGGRVTVTCAIHGAAVHHHAGESGAKPARGQLEISVSDTGHGIPQDKLALIFEPFVQLDRHRTHESQQGVGLGLAISRDLARQLGGDLSAESVVHHGSTFRLRLPLSQGESGHSFNLQDPSRDACHVS